MIFLLNWNNKKKSVLNDRYGGIARMPTMIKRLRARNANVLTLHAGDVFVGTFAFNKYLGYPELKITCANSTI